MKTKEKYSSANMGSISLNIFAQTGAKKIV